MSAIYCRDICPHKDTLATQTNVIVMFRRSQSIRNTDFFTKVQQQIDRKLIPTIFSCWHIFTWLTTVA